MQFNEKAIHPEEKMASIMDKTISPSSYCVSPDPALQFVFGLFGLMTWISTVVSTTPDAMLVKGVLQVCLGIAAFAGSCIVQFFLIKIYNIIFNFYKKCQNIDMKVKDSFSLNHPKSMKTHLLREQASIFLKIKLI